LSLRAVVYYLRGTGTALCDYYGVQVLSELGAQCPLVNARIHFRDVAVRDTDTD